ncbi:MAG: RNA polymerase subunit sigma-70 [Bacteroidetes bacterium CG18_big_fil_WC_8_21_14_2_50_41_14]|nr:MAG: RNA polymerase subunit sigma-70 [Bacteroidetes bacterium CG18_big_fil_WC_8_21_14_2_50_41_14]PJB59807.1 MAG: RNA polymerase subunit sigma-70 [Bacteroidetes bacterium CG_4_9_14_3_um_filter_41_19]
MQSEIELITACLRSNRKAQKRLFEKFAPEMKQICLRYCNNQFIAEEALQEGFMSVFNHLGQLKDPTKLRAWIKQIMLNTSLMKIRKKDPLVFYSDELLDKNQKTELFTDEPMQYNKEDLKQILNGMPKGYKIIFNLYAFEHYSHKQIAETLNISENTSKSQLSRARNYLREKLRTLKLDYTSELTGLIGAIVTIIGMR